MSTSEGKGISGWLILVAIGLVVAPFRLYFTTLTLYPDLFENGSWSLLTDPSSTEYVRGVALLLYSEIVFNLFLLSCLIYLIYLFFSKKAIFPKAYITVSVIGLIYLPINAVMASMLFPQTTIFDTETIKDILLTLVSAAIWIPYMLRSSRVKNTFVEGHSFKKVIQSVFVMTSISVVGYLLYLQEIKHVPENLTIEDKLVQLVNEVNKSLPKMLDSETKLDSVYTELNNLEYRYSLVNYNAIDIDANFLHENMRPSIVSIACSNSATVSLIQEGVNVSYTYFDKVGEYITTINVRSSDCV